MGRAQAVLFDMDGTLVDSEKLWGVGMHELAASYGAVLGDAVRDATVGVSADRAVAMLLDALGVPLAEAPGATASLTRHVMELFAEGLDWRPGARRFVAAVRAAGLRTALVTNTQRSLVDVALGTLGAANFDAVICGDEVPHTKPDPAPYRMAAVALGLAPGVCVAIEDSPAGVRSALDAGCFVVAVPGAVALDGIASLTVASLLDLDVGLLHGLVTAAG